MRILLTGHKGYIGSVATSMLLTAGRARLFGCHSAMGDSPYRVVIHGTVISLRDIFITVQRPMIFAAIAAVLPLTLQLFYGNWLSPLLRLLIGGSAFLGVYLAMLLQVIGQKELYMGLVRGFKGAPPVAANAMASA